MELMIRQRVFSWTDTYDVYDESGEAIYFVKAEFFAFGHQIHVYDKRSGQELGRIHERLLTFMPTFEIVLGGETRGTVRKRFKLFSQNYEVDYCGWDVEGDFLGWDYRVLHGEQEVMCISKELFHWGDCYVLHFASPDDELPGLLLALAIDAANCSGED